LSGSSAGRLRRGGTNLLAGRAVEMYYEILEGTLIRHRLEPWTLNARKRLVA